MLMREVMAVKFRNTGITQYNVKWHRHFHCSVTSGEEALMLLHTLNGASVYPFQFWFERIIWLLKIIGKLLSNLNHPDQYQCHWKTVISECGENKKSRLHALVAKRWTECEACGQPGRKLHTKLNQVMICHVTSCYMVLAETLRVTRCDVMSHDLGHMAAFKLVL